MKPRRGLIFAAAAAAAATVTAISMVLCGNASALLHGLAISHYGAKVNATTGGSFCTLPSGDTCQPGEESAIPGGFGSSGPWGVAVNADPASPDYGNIYVADQANNRVQELTPSGQFVRMFGREVNETKVNMVNAKGGTPTQTEVEEENVCTQVEVEAGAKCKAGAFGSEAGALEDPQAVAVDPTTGNVYVTESGSGNDRVDGFTANGRFILMIGKHVNETTGGNVCTQTEIEAGRKCKGGELTIPVSAEHGAFFLLAGGNEIAVGGPKDLLYVGGEHRLQEFEANGTWVGEISLENVSAGEYVGVQGVAVDQASGDVYLTYSRLGGSPSATSVYEFDANGNQLAVFPVSAREPGATVNIEGIALDSSGHLALSEEEQASTNKAFGALLDAANGKRLTEFALPPSNRFYNSVSAFSYDAAGGLYGASRYRYEMVSYLVKEGAELIIKPAGCKEGTPQESSVPFECTLNGEANPSNVKETEVWFQWATKASLESAGTLETAKQALSTSNTLGPVSAKLEGLRPNETYYYRLAGYDQNFKPPTPALISEELSTTTKVIPPKIVGEPNVSFVKPTSTVMSGELNPENAETEYFFEYGAGEALAKCPGGIIKQESCQGVASTTVLTSSTYGKIGATLEATGLQPGTTYHYRLAAVNEKQEAGVGPEGSFTTAPRPVPQAETGAATAITSTSALISGTIDPQGQPAVYTFELGIYTGAKTQYGIVLSGSTGEGATLTPETLALSGLQPGTTYAYRIAIQDAYTPHGEPVRGATHTFTTVSTAPPGLAPTIFLPIPKTCFPGMCKPTPPVCKHGFKRDKHGHCVKVKKRKPSSRKRRSLSHRHK
jgi:hypothetical protein